MSKYIDADKIEKFANSLDPLSESRLMNALHIIATQIPTEDVAPVIHAHWEWNDDERGWIDWKDTAGDDRSGWRCSHCKELLVDMVGGQWDEIEEPPQLNYCPSCGAKMDEEKQDA